ncbi:MAG: MFS transporter, partial [Myxococcota bacterium]
MQLQRRKELGAAFAVYHRGKKVADLWGGYRDKQRRNPWQEEGAARCSLSRRVEARSGAVIIASTREDSCGRPASRHRSWIAMACANALACRLPAVNSSSLLNCSGAPYPGDQQVIDLSRSEETGPFNPSPAYSNYVLGLLMLVAAFNLLDRQVIGMLIEPIKQEFDVSDSWIGLLTGFSYAVFYAAAGIPIARWADRGVRRSIVALGLLLWSGLTLASGFVQSFGYLVLARLGVGIGEAAGTPPSHSLISDYFPPPQRATALAKMSVGSALGVMMSYFAGGWLNELYGWRVVLIVFGVPGICLAALIRFTLKEPPRGRFDRRVSEHVPSLSEALGFLLRLPSYRHLILGASLHSFAFAGASVWYPSFLVRVHGLSTGEIGTALALSSSAMSALGIYAGGR